MWRNFFFLAQETIIYRIVDLRNPSHIFLDDAQTLSFKKTPAYLPLLCCRETEPQSYLLQGQNIVQVSNKISSYI